METGEQGELARVVRVDGIKLALGSMSLGELLPIQESAITRVETALAEARMIGQYINRLTPEVGDVPLA